MHFSILLCYTSMYCWKDSSGMPLSLSLHPFWRLPCLQNGSPWWPSWAWGKKESHTEQGQANREVVPARQFSFRPRTAGGSGHCEQVHCRGEAATICLATALVSSRALSKANAAGVVCRLADWLSGPVVRPQSRRCLSYRRMWSTWLWILTLTVLLSLASQSWTLPLRALVLGFRAVLKSSRLITSDWLFYASLVYVEDAQWCPDTSACGAPSAHH